MLSMENVSQHKEMKTRLVRSEKFFGNVPQQRQQSGVTFVVYLKFPKKPNRIRIALSLSLA